MEVLIFEIGSLISSEVYCISTVWTMFDFVMDWP